MDHESFNTKQSLATLVRTVATSKSVLLQPPLSYSAVKRLIVVGDDEEIEVNEDAPDSGRWHCPAEVDACGGLHPSWLHGSVLWRHEIEEWPSRPVQPVSAVRSRCRGSSRAL